MKKMKYGTILLALFLGGYVSLDSASAKDATYSVGILDFPPYAVIEKSGDCKGILVELIEQVLEQAGIDYTLKGFPQKRLFRNLSTGEINIYMGVKAVPAYETEVLFSDFPVEEIDLRVFTRKGTPVIRALGQLKGKKVIVIMGYGYGGLIRYLKDPAMAITLDPSRTHILAFRKLGAKRADYVLDYYGPASEAMEEAGIEDLQSHSILKLEVYFIVSKKTPGATRLLDRMEKAYQTLKAAGKL